MQWLGQVCSCFIFLKRTDKIKCSFWMTVGLCQPWYPWDSVISYNNSRDNHLCWDWWTKAVYKDPYLTSAAQKSSTKIMALGFYFLLCLIFVTIITTQSHPTLYPEVKLEELQAEGVWPPPFRSYHIHCLFQEYDPVIKDKAEALKKGFIKQFNLENVEMCQGLFHQGKLCMFGKWKWIYS